MSYLIPVLLTPSLPRPTHFVAEEAMKARREIADYIKNKRTERARIRASFGTVILMVLVPGGGPMTNHVTT